MDLLEQITEQTLMDMEAMATAKVWNWGEPLPEWFFPYWMAEA